MILVALVKGFQNHIGFAIIRASVVRDGKAPERAEAMITPVISGPEAEKETSRNHLVNQLPVSAG